MVGSIVELWRYPVKSMQGEPLSTCRLGPDGVAGDRSWAIVDPARGYPVSAKQAPVLMTLKATFVEEPGPDGHADVVIESDDGQHRFDSRDPDVDAQLSAFFRHPLTLRRTAERGFFDDAPLHLLTCQTLERLSQLASRSAEGSQFDRRRFRANLIVEVAGETVHWPEQRWSFRSLTIGDLDFTVRSGTERCAMVTMPFADLPADPRVLKSTMQSTRGIVGVYLSANTDGQIKVGDDLSIGT